jgi:hypothetical protein
MWPCVLIYDYRDFVRVAKRIRIIPVKPSSRRKQQISNNAEEKLTTTAAANN